MTVYAGAIIYASGINDLPVPLGRVGGIRYSGTGNFGTGLGTSETITNMDSGAVVLQASREYRIQCRVHVTYGATQNVTWRIRRTNAVGTLCGGLISQGTAGQTTSYDLWGQYETTAAEAATHFVTTTQTNTSTISVVGSALFAWILIEDLGPSGGFTKSATP